VDTKWALGEIDNFLALTKMRRPTSQPGVISVSARLITAGNQTEIIASAQVVEQIFDRVIRDWRTLVSSDGTETVNRWVQHREAAMRVRTEILRQEEVREKLGDNAPLLSASQLHPWVWDGARSLWQSAHYREAIRAGSIKLNAETQNKTGRFDVVEADLFKQVFTADPPQPGKPRLRVLPADQSKTFLSFTRGVMAYAEGCYAAIRNPSSHAIQDEMPEGEALEQLAAFSVLARWVDSATVITATEV